MTARGLVIAATRSGAGKTTVTLALLAALARRGVAVRSAKAGPDYIDPAFHAAATGAPSVNLDSWAMPPDLLDAVAAEAARHAQMLVIEGVLGLFDGLAGPPGRRGATADLAARFRLPVLLILDVAGQSQSAAAVARGFCAHDPAVRIAGVLLNRVGSERHRILVADAMETAGVPVLGVIPRDKSLVLPERHLGLVQASEHADLDARLAHLADLAERHVDIDAVIEAARPPAIATHANALALPPPGQRIAIASDAAFTFVYPHLLAGWRSAGAEIFPFSPLADEAPPEHCDCCWLPGGYPELHAGTLAAAHQFRTGLARFAETRPVHGECGGYMALGEYIEDAAGEKHAMAGLLGHATSFAQRRLHLGYRAARLLADSPIGPDGSTIRGHEFHYASLVEAGNDDPLADIFDGNGRRLGKTGGRRGRVTGTFFHVIAGATLG
ncbi:MAG: cobyrinate a,c-diamide synthase [Xanthobacteraceae bacterium]